MAIVQSRGARISATVRRERFKVAEDQMNTHQEMQVEQPTGVRTEAPRAASRGTASGRRWGWSIALCILAVAGYVFFPRVIHGQAHPAAAANAGRPRAMMVPVVGAVAQRADVPVYLNGLGTVTSLNTVTVHSRVDGQLVSVMFKEGQLVHQGELLAQIDPRPFEVQLSQAEGQLAKDQAALKNAQLDLQRYQNLYAQDAIPQQQLATQTATVTQDEGAIRSDQAQVDNAKLNLTYSRITSPITGRIGLRLVDPGNIVHASDPNGLIVITQRQPIAVLFTLPEDSLPAVLKQLHGGGTLAVEAWDRDFTNRLATGTLLTVDNAIDPTTGTVRLKATFPNQDETLFPNQFVNARLLLDTLKGVMVVPAAAIQRNQQSTFVYVVKPDQTVELRTVDVRLTEGDSSAVDSGLSPGETVVVEGVDKLQPGTKVAVRLPGANRDEPRSGRPGAGTPAGGSPASGAPSSPGAARRRPAGGGNQ